VLKEERKRTGLYEDIGYFNSNVLFLF
jgi:hypothetical protein